MADKRYPTVYEDDSLIVVDKPSGMLVIPSPNKEKKTLTALINADLDRRGVEVNAYPCHRLDRETSGLIIFAKGKAAQGAMMAAFRERTVKKTYIAFVHGRVKKDFATVDSPIYNRNKDRMESAVTKYRVRERRGAFSVLEVEPVTGRTNQIRIHLKAAGHPLVGESLYVFRKDFALTFKRVALHAARLEFSHPYTGRKLVFESPLPADMKKFLLTTSN